MKTDRFFKIRSNYNKVTDKLNINENNNEISNETTNFLFIIKRSYKLHRSRINFGRYVVAQLSGNLANAAVTVDLFEKN